MNKVEAERIILGIDPGTQQMGYGILQVQGKKLILLQLGVIHLTKYTSQELKLKKIFEKVTGLIEEFLPDEMAIEAPFFGKNVQSMLKLGRAQGVAMAAALMREIPISEYAPKKIKQSVTGNGNASKEQVAAMVKNLLNYKEDPEFLDATDAVAAALCHYYQGGMKQVKSSKNWASFLSENPDRLKA